MNINATPNSQKYSRASAYHPPLPEADRGAEEDDETAPP